MKHSPHNPVCIDLADRLSEYLDGELPGELKAQIVEHFQGCSRCERFLRSLENVKGLGLLLPAVELDSARLVAIRDRVKETLGP